MQQEELKMDKHREHMFEDTFDPAKCSSAIDIEEGGLIVRKR